MFIQVLGDDKNNGTLRSYRREIASLSFSRIYQYDMNIAGYFDNDNNEITTKRYIKTHSLKYGLNPSQKKAGIYRNIYGQTSN